MTICECLETLGYTAWQKGATRNGKIQDRKGTFWEANYGRLHYILWDCKNLYLAACKKHHPDNGGDTANMQVINEAWSRLQKLFSARRIV